MMTRMCRAIRHRPEVLALQSDLSLIRVFCHVNPLQRSRSDHFVTPAGKQSRVLQVSQVSPTFYKPLLPFSLLYLLSLLLPPDPPARKGFLKKRNIYRATDALRHFSRFFAIFAGVAKCPNASHTNRSLEQKTLFKKVPQVAVT